MGKLKTAILRAQETADIIGTNESLLWQARDALSDEGLTSAERALHLINTYLMEAELCQTLNIDGTRYTLKFDKCPIEWAKLARKPYKPKKPEDIRKFPVRSDLSTAEYVRQYDELNFRVPVRYWPELNTIGTAHYDPTIPLLEDLSNE